MKTTVTTLIVLLAMTHAREHKYFEYEIDCGEECVSKKESCTIAEPTKDTFVRDCYVNTEACERKASPIMVCLSENKEPSGGSLIWNDYKEKFYPEKVVVHTYMYILSGLLILIVGMLMGCITQPYMLRCLRYRRNGYEQFPSNTGVYQTTVRPATDDGRDEEESHLVAVETP